MPLQVSSPAAGQDVVREPGRDGGTPVDIEVDGPSEKNGPVYHLQGNVRIRYRTYLLRADDITYNEDTGEAVATGHVRLEGGPRSEI
ncbi:MAG TPA: hypothetical protein VE998_12295, partial [Terriglobales bacterium]|nr:hypothetical protein [Terriglobales bacterium]